MTVPCAHTRAQRATQLIALLAHLGVPAGVGAAGSATSLPYYQGLAKGPPDNLDDISKSILTLQNQLDSSADVALQNRRGLDLLTAEKGGLFLLRGRWLFLC